MSEELTIKREDVLSLLVGGEMQDKYSVSSETNSDSDGQGRERTCRMVECHDWCDEWEPYGIYCSECGEFVHGWFSELWLPIPDECHNCGAKVVEP